MTLPLKHGQGNFIQSPLPSPETPLAWTSPFKFSDDEAGPANTPPSLITNGSPPLEFWSPWTSPSHLSQPLPSSQPKLARPDSAPVNAPRTYAV